MILNSTKFGGNRTEDLEVGPDRQTDRPIPIYPPNYVCGVSLLGYKKNICMFGSHFHSNITFDMLHLSIPLFEKVG
jgi:hypothetical protein